LLLQFLPPLDKFVFSNDVVVNKFLDLNVPVVVQVALAEQFIHNLASVIFIDAFLGEEHHHLVSVHIAIAIDVDSAKLVIQFALLLILAHTERLVVLEGHFI